MASSSGKFYQSGYERFQWELQRDGLREEPIKGDGSCMYHSIADQLQVNLRKSYDYQYVKGRIMQHIIENADTYKKYVEYNDIERYIENKERDGVWGGIIELKVAAKVFKVNIYVYSTTDPSWGIKLFEDPDVKTLLLSYHGNSHYNSLRKTTRGTFNFFQSNQQTWPAPKQSQEERRKQQFLDELRKEQLEIVEVLGTGNRLFHAVADQLQQVLGLKIDHKRVKDDILSHIKENKRKYKIQIGDVNQYAKKMKGIEYNGTKFELEVVAAHFKVNVKVFCTDESTYIIKSPSKSDKWIFLSYHDNSYYNSLEKITNTQPEEVHSHISSTAQDSQNTLSSNSNNNYCTEDTLCTAEEYYRQYLQQQPIAEYQNPTTETEVEPTNQELEEGYNEFRRELAEEWGLEIVPLKMGSGDRLIHCIAHQIQQVYPECNYDYNRVETKIQQHINNHKGKYQGPRGNGGNDVIKTAGVVFKVNVTVYQPNKNPQEIRLDRNVKKSISLGCFNGNFYDSLRKITESSSDPPGLLTETQTQRKSEHDTLLEIPSVQEISRSPKPESSSNFEKNFQEFQTKKENDEIMEKVVTQEGSGYFHSIADQLQNLEDRWEQINSGAVEHKIKTYISKYNVDYGPKLNHQFEQYMTKLTCQGFEVDDLDLQIVSQTFEVNVVLYNLKYSRQQIQSGFRDKPETIYLSYDGIQFKSLRRKENTHDQQKDAHDEDSGSISMDIDDN